MQNNTKDLNNIEEIDKLIAEQEVIRIRTIKQIKYLESKRIMLLNKLLKERTR